MTKPFLQNYAFGLMVQSVGGHKVISHGGGIQGFNTELELLSGRQSYGRGTQ